MAAVAATSITQKQCVGFNLQSPAGIVDENPRFKTGYILAGATVDTSETIALDLFSKFGITKFLGISGYVHTTANSVMIVEAPTTAVVNNTLTITVGGSGANNLQRLYAIYGI